MLLFELKLNSFNNNNTTRVLQLSKQSNDIQDSLRIFVAQKNLGVFAILNGTAKFFNVAKLQLLGWTSIKINQEAVNNKYIFTVSVNGITVISNVNTQPLHSKNVILYASDPVNFSQNGSIRSIIFITWTGISIRWTDAMFINQVTSVPYYTQLATLDVFYEEFVISFEALLSYDQGGLLFLNNFVINFPKIEIGSNRVDLKRLLNIASFINLDTIKNGKWQLFEISQVFENNKYTTYVTINGLIVFSQVNKQPKVSINVAPMMGRLPIRSLYIVTKSQATWSAWSEWSSCNMSCNIYLALSSRTRKCNRNILIDCIGNKNESKSCPEIIASWNQWSPWSICVFCGLHNRTRSCSSQCLRCIGSNIQKGVCPCVCMNQSIWNVSNSISIEGSDVLLNLQIYRICDSGESARVQFEYFLPPFFTFLFENVIQGFIKIDANRLNYVFNGNFTASDTFDYTFIVTYNDSTCPMPGVFNLDIPFKFSYQIGLEKTIKLTKNHQTVVECFINQKKKTIYPILKESYGRGIYWDSDKNHIYVCINQHYASTVAACYYSDNNGDLWDSLDVQVGSVIGHHSITRELYAVHRNRKTYLVFSKTHKRWFSLTNDMFIETAVDYIDPYWQKNLESDYEQIHSIGPYQWRANAEGLFFRESEEDFWIQRVQWRL